MAPLVPLGFSGGFGLIQALASMPKKLTTILNCVAQSPRWRLGITLFLTIAIGVLSSVYATQITPGGILDVRLGTKVASFWWLVGVSVLWVYVHIQFLKYDESLARFADDEHCIAFVRRMKLEALAADIKASPEKGLLLDARAVLKNIEVGHK